MIKLTLLNAGYCTHPEFVVMKGGQRQSVPFPAGFALLEHSDLGPILFDTGYSYRFYSETSQFPASLYAKITPVFVEARDTAQAQLEALGIVAEDIQTIIISHFHADHIGGLRDFPNARFIFLEAAYEAVRNRRGFKAVLAGYLPGLLPADFEDRMTPLSDTQYQPIPFDVTPFDQGIDVFNDRTVWAVDLPGHAIGQMGLFVQTDVEELVFLAADVCWTSSAYRELRWPHSITKLILADPKAFRATLRKVHHLHQHQPNLQIILSHCQESYARYQHTHNLSPRGQL